MLRTLIHTDAEAAASLIRTAFESPEVPLDPPPSALRVTAADLCAHLDAGGGGTIEPGAGCLLWSVRDGGLYVSRLAVLPAARGCGLATALLHEAERHARDTGLPRLHLEVRLALRGNRRLFARAGFVEGDRHTHPGYATPTFVAATKPIFESSRSASK